MTANSKANLIVGVAFVAIAVPAAGHAMAAAAAPTVQEIVVTADKREENLRDVAQSVTAISGDSLEVQRAVSFEDYVTRVPGMNLVSTQPGATRLVLRGINAGGVSATIGTYVDETPYGSVTGLSNGAVLAPDFDTFDIKRVEVLRGPQGTLYGASSLGGLLKFVTNAPDPSGYSGRIEVDGDTVESGSASGSVKGVFNAPVGGSAAIRLGGYYNHQSGYIDDPIRHARNVDGVTISGARLGILVRPSDKLSLRLSAVAQDINSQGTSIEDVNRLTLDPVHGDLTQSRTFSAPNKVTYRVYNLTADYDLGFASLLSATSYGTLRQEGNGDATAQLGPTLTAIFKQPLGTGVIQNLRQKKFTQEIRLASPAQTFEWLVGAFYTRETNNLDQSLNAISLSSPPQIVAGLGGLQVVGLPTVYDEYAGFANVDYHFTDRFDVSVGGRYSHNKQSETQFSSGPLAGPTTAFTGASSEDVFTFAVAPKYKLSDTTTVYARVSKGYRPGGPNALSPLAPAAVPRTFQSDSIIDYEAGIKADLLDRSVSLELTAFYIDWSDIQLLVRVGNFGVNANAGSAESKGLEGSFTYVPIQGLTLSANGAYTDAILKSDTGPLLGGHNGDRLPYSSPVSGSLSAEYTTPLTDDTRLFVGASARFTGRRRSDFNATFGQTSLPSYTTVDMHAGLDRGRYRVEAYVKNLSDERGILFLGGIGSTPNGAVQAGVIRPRTIGLTLSATY
jgi:outer membrane receptor protein involved in Fe transport